ncbi:unnamed protein product [Moneuplotes crassus]|uniref:Uncharacterized protein n=1 Tax=Euplotes crassus TaxID=5936 RepID=A0AAD1XM83_EUPCR|nr:unnamed protein product [Moneuplotes crassus]
MGNGHSAQDEYLLEAILTNQEAEVSNILTKDSTRVNAPLLNGMTNPICRAAYLGKRNMVALILKHQGDINLKCGGKGNTPLMWSAWRNNVKMVQFLVSQGADIEATNNEGLNALDVAIVRVSYATALFLKKQGLSPKPAEFYEDKLQVKFDVELFIEKLENEEQVHSFNIFYKKIEREEQEWLSKDLVIDPRETWKKWLTRNMNFEEPPMVPREDIPEDNQPHTTFYGKMTCYLNGINPYPPGHKNNPAKTNDTVDALDKSKVKEPDQELGRNREENKEDDLAIEDIK